MNICLANFSYYCEKRYFVFVRQDIILTAIRQRFGLKLNSNSSTKQIHQ